MFCKAGASAAANTVLCALMLLSGCAHHSPPPTVYERDEPLPENKMVYVEIDAIVRDRNQVQNICVAYPQDQEQVQACWLRIFNVGVERIILRYPDADFAMLAKRCKAYLDDCSDLRKIEIAARASALERRREIREAETAESRQRAANAIAAAGQGFSNGMNQYRPVHCTTTALGGGMASTNCN
jgi:hypothetical protein